MKSAQADLACPITTSQFLDMCADKLGTDYKTSKALGKHASYISNMRGRGGILSDETAIKIADILDFPVASILLCLAAERAVRDTQFEGAEKVVEAAEMHLPRKAPARREIHLSTRL
ncbi:hypothetical protein HBA55_34770 [Pseudomaricurvus alkylphenolicus]|uniref:hypothetical protein n=1 Tax=Pseudomaricurvus alkylphenolicus TaxID=1306991 RepID=UPI00142456B5|nr:hypothetical protein [Pseudomaricurvus alkylphenolicus]NIB44796.1 hypothetical protein [Pseudomaricurvus alkylphenolicus]